MAVSKQKQNLRRARSSARLAVQAIQEASDNIPWVSAQVSLALREIAALRDGVSDDEAFKDVLVQMGLDAPGASLILESLNDVQGFQRSALTKLAEVPVQDITTARLTNVLIRYIETPECLHGVKSRLKKDLEKVAKNLDPNQEFTPLLNWLVNSDLQPQVKAEALARLLGYVKSGHAAQDLTDVDPHDPTVVEMKAMMAKMREGEFVSSHEADGILSRRLAQICVPMSAIRLDLETRDRPIPMAEPADISTFSMLGTGAVEGSGRMDVVIRDAKDPKKWHIVEATSSEDTFSQNDQLARHHQALRNRIKAGQRPFCPDDDIASLTFISPALLTASNQKKLVGSGPAFSQTEIESINSLSLLAQLGHTFANKEMRVASVLRFEHTAIGGPSAAKGGFGLSEEQLINQGVSQWARAVQALNHPGRKMVVESAVGGFNQTLLKLLCRAGRGFRSHFPRDAEKSLRLMAPHLRQLGEKVEHQGHYELADELDSLARDVESIDAKRRERPTPDQDKVDISDADISTVIAHEFGRLERHQQIQFLVDQNDWSADMERRWTRASAKASPALWNALLLGATENQRGIQIYELDANRARLKGFRSVLDLNPRAQGQWVRNFIAQKNVFVMDKSHEEIYDRYHPRKFYNKTSLTKEQKIGLKIFCSQRLLDADDYRASNDLSIQDTINLEYIMAAAHYQVWHHLMRGNVSIDDVIRACNKHGESILDCGVTTQAFWLKKHFSEPDDVCQRLLRTKPVSEQHANFLKLARPALEQGLLSDVLFESFDRVARHGVPRLYQAVMSGKVAVWRLAQGENSGERLLGSKRVQEEWLRYELDTRTTTKPARAAVVIQKAYEEQASQPATLRPRRRQR